MNESKETSKTIPKDTQQVTPIKEGKTKELASIPTISGNIVQGKDFINLLKIGDSKDLFEFVTKLVKSKHYDGVTPEDAVSMILKAKELGVPPITALDHMFLVNGKTGIDVHVIMALVLSNGGYFSVIEDAEPIMFIDKLGRRFTMTSLPDNAIVANDHSKEKVDAHKASGGLAVARLEYAIGNKTYPGDLLFSYEDNKARYNIIDKRTTILMSRDVTSNNRTRTIEYKASYSNRDALTAGLFLNRKNEVALEKPWIKHNNNQLYVRAFTLAARRIWSDKLLGVYEKTEILDSFGINYDVTEEGTVTVIT
jgi:hypothetical protein